MSKQRDAILYWTISRSIRLNTRTYEETVHSISFWLSKFTLSPCMQSRMKELVMLNEQRKPRKKSKPTIKTELD